MTVVAMDPAARAGLGSPNHVARDLQGLLYGRVGIEQLIIKIYHHPMNTSILCP